jgi:predicted benzoate:H+ symporter BenE
MNDTKREGHVPVESGELRRRDAGMVRVMGFFFSGFALLVLIGQCWPQGVPERIVNLVAGLALLAAGVGALVLATRLGDRHREG